MLAGFAVVGCVVAGGFVVAAVSRVVPLWAAVLSAALVDGAAVVVAAVSSGAVVRAAVVPADVTLEAGAVLCGAGAPRPQAQSANVAANRIHTNGSNFLFIFFSQRERASGCR